MFFTAVLFVFGEGKEPVRQGSPPKSTTKIRCYSQIRFLHGKSILATELYQIHVSMMLMIKTGRKFLAVLDQTMY